MEKFLTIFKQRRSIYNLSNTIGITNEQLVRLLQEVIVNSPTAFNSQSSKVVLLLAKNHEHFWNHLVLSILEKITSSLAFEKTKQKINGFANAYGTILFFDDTSITESLMTKYPTYQAMFHQWADHASGMQQIAVWTVLTEAGIGASLQHYNPVIDDEIKKAYAINPKWRLIAQMPFGIPLSKANEKTTKSADELVKVIL